ncbi:lipoprotein-releasing system permease protein [Alloalcanivorax xenomutans]|uniref:ABC transporter permease n=1 Tax=Alloalcanivorax xenomutans TaxID=1094342 RepID=UPI000BCAB712|nr:ABC transporter permease [Alloalcanivorax xenomutans]SOC25877.1 lipoprotein-releasing system permease protein [Alloalcanivorax xenomutans]
MKVPVVLDLARSHVLGRGRQTLVAVLSVALGVGFSIAMAALMQGGEDDMIEQMVNAMPHVRITDEFRHARRQPVQDRFDAVAIAGLRPKEDRRGILNPVEVRARLSGWVPGSLAWSLRTQGVVRYAGRDQGLTLVGIEPDQAQAVAAIKPEEFIAGDFQSLAFGGNNLVVGDRLAEKLGARLGTTVSLVSATGESRSFKITGLFHTGTTARDEGEGYVLLTKAQTLSDRPNVINDIRLRLADPALAPEVARRAERRIGYKTVAWQEANESLLEALVVRNVIMYTVVGAILVVAGFGIFNIISTITHEKSRDIAILKSLGFTERDIRRLFVAEGVAFGVAGSVIGWMIGALLCVAMSMVRFELSGAGVAQEMTHLPLAWNVWHYLVAAGCALASASMAGYLPARRAARLHPVDIIRGAS